jgi:hypothetical protein
MSPRSCAEDGGRPPGVGLQGPAPNHRVLLRPKGVVVSDAGNAVPRGRQVRVEKVSESELPMTHRKERDAVETRGAGRTSDQSEGNLFTAQTAAGV